MLTVWLIAVGTWFLFALLHSFLKRSMYYWKERNVAHKTPLPLIGNFWDVATLKVGTGSIYEKMYKEFPDERVVGLYEFTTPTLLIRDPEVVEEVLVKNFTAFPDHGPFIFEPDSALHLGLFNLYGDRWRALRNKLLSTFASGRMKCIHPGMLECCEELLERSPEKLDAEAFRRFAVDSFLRSLFGYKLTPQGEKEFRQKVYIMFEAPLSRYLQQTFLTYFPKLADFLGSKYMPEDMDNYFRSIVDTLLNVRESMDYSRKDFVDVLLQLRNAKEMNIFSRENSKIDKKFEVDNHLVLCQGFMLFFAGMDTTSLSMMYTAFELASNLKIQEKARDEVRRMKKKHGSFTFEAIRDMKYMEQCIQEALRLHPALLFLMRISDRDTQVGGVPIKKGTRIIIPNYALQTDPKYYPNPQTYDPDRMHEDNRKNTTAKFSHLPFSDGPRVCLGKKFSLIEIATLLAHLLDKYELSVDAETKLPLEYNPRKVFLTPLHPVVIKLTKLE